MSKLADLKANLRLEPHPDITVAFDLAKTALVKTVNGPEKDLSAAEITRRMFRAVMDAGFLIMHRDEMQDAILVAAQVKTLLDEEPPPAIACARYAPDYQAQGDCRNCGHPQNAHARPTSTSSTEGGVE